MAAKSISMSELKSMLKPELTKHAQSLGIETKGLTKDQLLQAIEDLSFASTLSLGEEVGLTATKSPVDTAPFSLEVGDNMAIMKMKMEHEFRMRQLEFEKQERLAALEAEKHAREHEFKMSRLQAQAELGFPLESSHSSSLQFRVDSAAKLLPKLVSEQETETFLVTFEKIAYLNKWPKENWASVLQTQLKGKGLKVFSELSLEECQDYEKLKKAILTAYELCPEVYRKRFRAFKKVSTETHADFAFKLTQAFKLWLHSVKTWDNVELLRETFLMEQFLESMPAELKLWLADRDPKTLDEMSRLADQFVALRKSILPTEQSQDSKENMLVSSQSFIKSTRPWQKSKTPERPKVMDTPTGKQDENKRSSVNNKSDLHQIRCFYCQKTGHKIAQCRAKQQKEEKEAPKGKNVPKNEASQELLVSNGRPMDLSSKSTTVASQWPIHPLFKPYCTTAHVVNTNGSLVAIRVLRDTGALQSVIKQSVVSEINHTQTGQFRLLKGIASEILEVPLIELHLKTSKIDATVLCGVIEELPEGVDFLLGNDIACLTDEVELPLTQSVITRAQAAAAQQHAAVDNSAGSINNDEAVQAPTVENVGQSHVNHRPTTIVENIDLNAIQDREELINLQQQDENLVALFDQVLERDFPVGKPYYYVQDGVLMHHDVVRKTRQEADQVVIPRPLRIKILEMAHDIPASGHLGVHKTKARLWPHFYWPGISKQVVTYCRSCDKCQKLGKGGKPPKVPLVQVPIITEPWKRIAIDIVGPLPTCDKSKNRFILTVIDLATHYPEAIALTEHTAAQVAKALITVFSRFGFPSEILSDQGSDFTSELMRLFMSEFNIGHVKISADHAQSNAICERWNGQ